MNLYLISQNVNHAYDTYDSAVVVAFDEGVAKKMHPDPDHKPEWAMTPGWRWSTWAAPEYVTVRYLGKADDDVNPGVVCSSFNAG